MSADYISRLPGCTWGPDLTSAAGVALAGGQNYGPAVSYDQTRGVRISGAGSGYLGFPITAQITSASITISVRCWPEFAADEAVARVLFCTTAPKVYQLQRTAAGALSLNLGNTGIGTVALGNWQAYFRPYRQNDFTIVGTSGSTQLYLNGHQVGSWATAWTPGVPGAITIGADTAGNNPFLGVIGHVVICNQLWTAQEVANWHAGQTFNYRSRAVLYLPMRTDTHDVAGGRSLDVSGHGNHAYFGAGAATPTKLTGTRGYSFDGGDLLSVTSSDSLNRATGVGQPHTMLVALAHNSVANRIISEKGTNAHFVCQTGPTGAVPSGAVLFRVGSAGGAYTPVIQQQISIIHGVYTGTTCWIYLNGIYIMADVRAAGADNASPLYIGSRAGAIGVAGNIYTYAVWPEQLTPTQIALETRRLRNEIVGNS
jgi:hypothetical protein